MPSPFAQETPLILGGDIEILPDSCHGNCYGFDVESKTPGPRVSKDCYWGCGKALTKEASRFMNIHMSR